MILLAGAAVALAQQAGTGTLTGTVGDNVGVVPGATVTVTEAATSVVRTTTSNEAGLFRLPALPPGRYTLRVEIDGFRPINMTEIQLTTNEVRDLGRLTLQPGNLSESVTVTAEVTPVQTATSSRRATVTSDQLTNIQMKGRDIYGLLAILPGVQDTNLNRDFTTWTSMRDLTINGNPVTSKNVLVDGISVVDEGGTGNAFVNPNIDAVGEVEVIANGYTAENGRNNGGLVNMVTKSGTNQFRGSAWYNGRRDRFNSIDYFRKAQNLAKPLYRVNISGYGVGGPVIIPGLFDSRSSSSRKVYFFASQEYTDDARPSSIQRFNLPTELERKGDFSQTRITNGTIQPIIDPTTGAQFSGNVIPDFRQHPAGKAMLNLLELPNGILNPQSGQEWTSNSAYDQTPLHSRTNHVVRIDGVLTQNVRASFKFIKDREDNWSPNAFSPGVGFVNNAVPGSLYSGSISQVLNPRIVNEMNFGYTKNSWGFVAGNKLGAVDGFDYTRLYRSNAGIDPPRLEPFENNFSDPPTLKGNRRQVDEWPYLPEFTTSGGNRSNLAGFMTNNQPLPRGNYNGRWSFQDDISITHNRHNFKFGFYTERDSKTEPGSDDYRGSFAFGHNANNPQNTTNGYANMLLGLYNTYTETSNRVNKDARHWQTEGYLQDSWRISSSFTLDFGVRMTHSGDFYEVWNANTGFYPDLWNPAVAPRVYRLTCMDGRPGNQSCPTSQQRAIDPDFPNTFLSTAFNGNLVPGSGQQVNGTLAQGLPGKKPGTYYEHPNLVVAPRVGFAWDIRGDGKSAVRASAGTFYNFPRGGINAFIGGPPISFNRVIRWAGIDDISNLAARGIQFVESPINGTVAGGERPLSRSHNVNVAYQRDVGFNTVVEIAYVGNFTNSDGRTEDQNRLPLYVYGDPSNLMNNAPLDTGYLRTKYGRFPGMGSVNQFFEDLYTRTLKYNSMQLGVQRRLSRGLQLGMAYTLAKGEGYQGYDPYTEEIGGAEAIRSRYWGPTDVDRRHNLVINYSYEIPNPTPNIRVLRNVLGNWQVSGVTKYLSGTDSSVSCSSNNSGVANTNPSLTQGVTARCVLTGEPISSGYEVDTSLPEPDRRHFNLAAFAMAQPLSSTVGNFGDAPLGLFRHPSWSNWDLTLARRIPINIGRTGSVRIQIQAYNIFNQVQFTNLDTSFTFTGTNNSQINSANTGKYTAPTSGANAGGTTPPRQMGLTVRLDF
jgi:outer membrane receptor protein involved in Fe transport